MLKFLGELLLIAALFIELTEVPLKNDGFTLLIEIPKGITSDGFLRDRSKSKNWGIHDFPFHRAENTVSFEAGCNANNAYGHRRLHFYAFSEQHFFEPM